MLFGDDVKYYMPVSTTWDRENLRRIHFLVTKSFEAHATVCFIQFIFLNQCSFYSFDHCCYCVIITGSQKGVWWKRCHDWTTTTSWVWSKQHLTGAAFGGSYSWRGIDGNFFYCLIQRWNGCVLFLVRTCDYQSFLFYRLQQKKLWTVLGRLDIKFYLSK